MGNLNKTDMEIYNFEWSDIGDITLGRPNLGSKTYVAVYRLMQYTLKDVLERRLGTKETEELYKEAGKLAGTEFCKNILDIRHYQIIT